MKIEKISENQLRCTLTREDLAKRQIRLSELAYGAPKARELFQEMMQQALQDYGFQVDNTPLMIEAIPMSSDALVLIITKVDDPEELDSRFSRFSPDDSGSYEATSKADLLSGADDILDLIEKLTNARKSASDKKKNTADHPRLPGTSNALPADGTGKLRSLSEGDDAYNVTEFFLFHDLEELIRVSHLVTGVSGGPSSLFRNPEDGNYLLIVKKGDTEGIHFNKLCNILSEYAPQADYTPGMEEYFTEHLKIIAQGDALERLAQI